jgi:SpoVK/Ycf46/Vps4 family AAA+-type ATPase
VRSDTVEKAYSLDGLNITGDIDLVMEQMERFDRFLRGPDRERTMNMNLLFYGPPGTGKSELARYIGERLDREIISRRASDILDKWVGESEKRIRAAFEEAEKDEAILVMDEVESILFSRERAERSWEISHTNEFLTCMERFRGILICTSNRLKEQSTLPAKPCSPSKLMVICTLRLMAWLTSWTNRSGATRTA